MFKFMNKRTKLRLQQFYRNYKIYIEMFEDGDVDYLVYLSNDSPTCKNNYPVYVGDTLQLCLLFIDNIENNISDCNLSNLFGNAYQH